MNLIYTFSAHKNDLICVLSVGKEAVYIEFTLLVAATGQIDVGVCTKYLTLF